MLQDRLAPMAFQENMVNLARMLKYHDCKISIGAMNVLKLRLEKQEVCLISRNF